VSEVQIGVKKVFGPTFPPRRKAVTQKSFAYLHAVERLSDRSDDGASEVVNEKLAGLKGRQNSRSEATSLL
jgi:hypothetical protein